MTDATTPRWSNLIKTIDHTKEMQQKGLWNQSSWSLPEYKWAPDPNDGVDYWGEPAKIQTVCGTAHCVAGWAPHALGFSDRVLTEPYRLHDGTTVPVDSEWVRITPEELAEINADCPGYMRSDNDCYYDRGTSPCPCDSERAYLKHNWMEDDGAVRGHLLVEEADNGDFFVHVADWAVWKLGLTRDQALELFDGANSMVSIDQIVADIIAG